MCPNCFTSIAMAPLALLGASLGGAGSAIVPSLLLGAGLAAAGLRFRTVRAAESTESTTEETPS
jgi:hypothetical protein